MLSRLVIPAVRRHWYGRYASGARTGWFPSAGARDGARLGQHYPRSSYTRDMSAMRAHLVDQLPEERLVPVLELIRGDGRKVRAVATLEAVRARMSGATGIDEELSRLRDGDRGRLLRRRYGGVPPLVRRPERVLACPVTAQIVPRRTLRPLPQNATSLDRFRVQRHNRARWRDP